MSRCNEHNSSVKSEEKLMLAKRTEFHKQFVYVTHPHSISCKISRLIIKSESSPVQNDK